MGKRLITALLLLLPITLFAQNQTEQIGHIQIFLKSTQTK